MTDLAARRVGIGMLIAGLGFLILPLGDAIGKTLAADGVHPLQIGWGRWVAHFAIMAPLVLALHGAKAFDPRDLPAQIPRGLFLCAATAFFFLALPHLPLATITATLFVAPILVTALSGPILGERVGPRRWMAVVVGFCGMLLIVRPFDGSINIGSVFAVGAASCFACYLLTTRRLAGRLPPLVTMMWMGLVGVIAMSAIVWPVFTPFSPAQWGGIAAIGVVLVIGHGMVVWAADRVEASAMAPMPYLEMVTSTLVGLVFFDEFPEAIVWAGCALVVGGGLYIAWRESRNPRA
jgi:drug/metabolite transporter (DMT)-like permease